jgi:hypothetical protein
MVETFNKVSDRLGLMCLECEDTPSHPIVSFAYPITEVAIVILGRGLE